MYMKETNGLQDKKSDILTSGNICQYTTYTADRYNEYRYLVKKKAFRYFLRTSKNNLKSCEFQDDFFMFRVDYPCKVPRGQSKGNTTTNMTKLVLVGLVSANFLKRDLYKNIQTDPR